MQPLERLFRIVYYLLDRKNITANELALLLGVSKRTIYRDIDTLSLSGIPVYADRGQRGGFKLMENFVLNKSILTERDQNEILSALQVLATVKADESEKVLHKMRTHFNKDSPDWFEVNFTSFGEGSGIRNFGDIKTAVLGKYIIEIDYYSMKGEKSHRKVEPLQLQFKNRAWYLKGYCLTKQDIRLFKLSRARNIMVTDERFAERDLPVEDTNHERDFPEPITLVMKINPEMAYRVFDYEDEEDIVMHPDGSITITQVWEYENNELYGFILSFGEYAEVLAPEFVRQNIKEKAHKITEKYNEPTSFSRPQTGIP